MTPATCMWYTVMRRSIREIQYPPPPPLQQTQTPPHKLQWLQSLYFSCLLLNCSPPPKQIWHSLHPTWAPVMQGAQFEWSYRKIEKCEQSSQQPSIKSWLPHTLTSPPPLTLTKTLVTLPPPQDLSRLSGEHTICESWRQARSTTGLMVGGMSMEREQGVLVVPFPSLPPLTPSLIINSIIPQKVITSDWGRGG